jgi:hypothetical protein
MQHAKIIENTTIENNIGNDLQIAEMKYPDHYTYMSFIMKILNKRKAHGIWVWNNKGEGFFMPKKSIFPLISNDWLS